MGIRLISIVCLLCGVLHVQGTGLPERQRHDWKKQPLDSLVVAARKLNVTGYMQVQYQHAETDADGYNVKLANRANSYEQNGLKSFDRFGIRRGRIKLVYEDGLTQTEFQTNITEKGINVVDAYLRVKDPWIGTNMLKAGIFEPPFGHEVAYSASRNESLERAHIIQSLFPDECDLGAMLTLQAAESSPWHILKLESGLFAGNGVRPQIDSRMDFAVRLSAAKTFGNLFALNGGMSVYLGSVRQSDSSVFEVKDNAFIVNSRSENNIGKYVKRQFIGFDVQFRANTTAGCFQLRSEYIFGKLPGNTAGAYGFKYIAMEAVEPVYMRKMSGGYVLLAQDLGKTPFTAVIKYDRYNPNTEISGNHIDSKAEITMSTIGFGMLWFVYPELKLTVYYNIVKNETTDKLKNRTDANGTITGYGYEGNRKDNVFSLRLQYVF